MRRVMDGEVVMVSVREQVGEDRLGCLMYEWADPVPVPHVLVQDGTYDNRQPERPDGVTVTKTMAFPADCDLDLFRAKVKVGGEWLVVSGRPRHVASPIGWDMIVEAGVSDG